MASFRGARCLASSRRTVGTFSCSFLAADAGRTSAQFCWLGGLPRRRTQFSTSAGQELGAGSSVRQNAALTGRVAIVTGASSGIGFAVSQALAFQGMTVVMASRSAGKLEEAAAKIPGAVPVTCDVVDRSSVHDTIEKVVGRFGRVDLIVNCAGVMYFTLMRNLHYKEWDSTIATNCNGVVNMCGAALPHMLKVRRGHIVNISSDAAKQVFPALAVYNASKAFVNVFSKSLRAECVGTGIRVTDIQPGDTATNLLMQNTDQEAATKVGVGIGLTIGTGFDRNAFLDPDDVAAAVIYAVTAPAHVGVHEILIEPRDQMFGDPTAMGVLTEGMYGEAAEVGDDKGDEGL